MEGIKNIITKNAEKNNNKTKNMCIIAYGFKKDIGTQRFQNCLTNNPDGFFLLGFKRGSK